jgi:hypothetical protein
MSKAQALEVSPSELRPNSFNVNVMSPENEQKLENSIDRFDGLFKPILVREVEGESGYEILGGEHRWIVATKKGLATVPIWNLGPISDVQAKEISLADNARYGADDALELANLLKDLDESGDIVKSFLPYTEVDIASIFAASTIALDELEIEEKHEEEPGVAPEPPTARAPKTHTMMRFKVPIEDAEWITELIVKIQSEHGYTAEDQATNAGDALVHLLKGVSAD